MEYMINLFESALGLVPSAITLVLLFPVLWVVRWIIERRSAGKAGLRLRRQVATSLVSFAGLLTIIMVSPMSDGQKGQLVSLIGILLSAAIALSATTFLGNIMAGFMIRTIRNIRPGDFIEVDKYFGRVSDQGLFHIEIQTENRNLTTLPNLFMVTNPVNVIRSSGTIIWTEISLGYDIPRKKIEELLVAAAGDAGLTDAFVHVTELGDYSVTYRASGMLEEVRHLLSSRSQLRKRIMDRLHLADVEIVSPVFMNQRALPPDMRFVPGVIQPTSADEKLKNGVAPESMVFDKAEEAESVEKLRDRLEETGNKLDEAKTRLKESSFEDDTSSVKEEISHLESRKKWLISVLQRKEEQG